MENFIVIWTGDSGRQYGYGIYPINTKFGREPGIFIIAREIDGNAWEPCYIGLTDNLHDFPDFRLKQKCIRQYGATHLHVHLTSNDDEIRRSEVNDLVMKWNPPANLDQVEDLPRPELN